MDTSAAGQPSAVLSRSLSDFVIELSIALHKHAMYPDGHPSLVAAELRVAHRLDALLLEYHSLALGVARDQLIIEGVATDPRNPLLLGLARHLHRRDIGAVKFLAGVTREEIGEALRALATEVDDAGPAPWLGAVGGRSPWPHVRFFPLTYDQLELTDEVEPAEEAATADARLRTSQLWLDLARAALQMEESAAERPPTDPVVVAEAINTHAREQAYDQVIIGYLLKIAGELSAGDRTESAVLQQRVSRLIGALEPEQLRRLLALGGDAAQRQRFLLDAAQGMAVDAVLTLVRAATDMSQGVISTSLLRMFGKLAAHAEQGEPAVRSRAEVAFREQVQELVSGWELADPNPRRYSLVLEQMARDTTRAAPFDESTHVCEPERLVQMALEIGAGGAVVLDAATSLIERGDAGVLVDLLRHAPAESEVARMLTARVASAQQLAYLLDAGQAEPERLEWLVTQMGMTAADSLLDALAAASSRATRRRVLELLVQLGPALGPAVMARLPDAPWFFQRNLLILLDRLAIRSQDHALVPYATHSDARVRREAVRLLLKSPAEREHVLVTALRDDDEQVVRLALGAALEACPASAFAVVVDRLAHHTLESDLEVLAIRVVASVQTPAALDCLLECASAGVGWLGVQRLAGKSPRLIAALTALATHWPREPRAVKLLTRAARHTDPAVRAAVAAWQGDAS